MRATSLGLATSVLVLTGSHVAAQTDANDAVGWGQGAAERGAAPDENDVVGWGQQSETSPPVAEPDLATRRIDAGMSGYVRSDWAMWSRPSRQPNRFAKGRQSIDLELRARSEHLLLLLGAHVMVDLAYLVDREEYGRATLDAYELLVRSRDSYAALSFDHIELALGFQRVAFGAGELFSVVDVVNPRDQREPGLTALEDRRLPVLMSRLTAFWKRHRLELIGVHEAYLQLRPPPLGFYSPIRSILFDSPLAPFITPEQLKAGADYEDDPGRWAWASQQGFGRWTFSGRRLDAGVYAGSAIDDPGVIDIDATALSSFGVNDPVMIPLLHKRYTMVGTSIAKPIGDWLVHGELAVDIDRPVQLADLTDLATIDFTFRRRTLARWLVGVRYTGIKSGAITLEYTQGSTGDIIQADYPIPPLLPVNPFFVGVRWQQGFLRDRLLVEIVAVAVGPRQRVGGFARAQATYKVVSNFSVTAGYIAYLAGDVPSLLNGYGQNDRLFARLRWDFATN